MQMLLIIYLCPYHMGKFWSFTFTPNWYIYKTYVPLLTLGCFEVYKSMCIYLANVFWNCILTLPSWILNYEIVKIYQQHWFSFFVRTLTSFRLVFKVKTYEYTNGDISYENLIRVLIGVRTGL
jgi:hypothetical protein